ncbi:MAG: DUF362 domain-containing protein [bacterium]|nr:DUF362 domain-containing protein [bacterium]
MTKKISRRTFIKNTTTMSAGALIGSTLLTGQPVHAAVPTPGISVATGANPFENAIEAVDALGGISKFIPKNARVAILANPQRHNPGAYTHPEVLKAAIQLCKKAGAKEINCISWLPDKNWTATGLKKIVSDEKVNLKITDLKDETLFKPVPVPKGKVLKEARIMKEYFNNDVLINLPICKDHAGNKFTGTLKNLMGLNSPKNNRTFHKSDWATNIDSIRYLDQCIADLNTVITPTLCIVDASEFIITNGPFGPGKLHKPQKIIAGTDRVAIDAYCSTLWNLDANSIYTITAAHQHGLGEINLKKVNIKNTREKNRK